MALSARELTKRNRMLRDDVERSLGRSITDEGWAIFLDKEVDDSDPYSPELVEVLVETYPRYELVTQRPSSRRIPPRAATNTRQSYEEALAWFATRRQSFSVDQFRRSVLGQRLIPARRARAWLDSLVDTEGEERGLPHSYRRLVSVPMDSLIPVLEVPVVELRNPVNGRDYWAPVPGGSNADWLRRVAINWAADVGCTNPEATLWVISGAPPSVEMIRTVFHPASPTGAFGERIEMTVDPATSPQEVKAAYSQARGEVAGRRVRTQSPKHLQLAIFADQRPTTEIWAESMRRWNDANRAWRYSYLPNFARDVVRARQLFLNQRPFSKDQG